MKYHPITGVELFPLDEKQKASAIKNAKITIHMFPRQP
jgi:hypothetical protein